MFPARAGQPQPCCFAALERGQNQAQRAARSRAAASCRRAHVGLVCMHRYATGTSGKMVSPRRSRRARRRKQRGERTALRVSHTPFVAFQGEWVVVCLGLWRRQGYLRNAFHGHDPPFVVFVLFVVNTNRRPMPPSRGRSLYKADMRPLPHSGPKSNCRRADSC